MFYLAALALGVLMQSLSPLPFFVGASRYAIGSVFVIVSAAITLTVIKRFRRANTPLDVRKPASALVTNGPYRFSRNPAYVSLTLLYLGIGILLGNGWVLILVAPVLIVMDRWVVVSEERHLEAKFGEQYLRYKSDVRRWL